MSNPNDWKQINFIDVSQPEIPPTTTTTTTATTRSNNSSIDQGRLARPIRRRSRASRRTPTTLLNTDTTNFRAMVQQFTGSPAAARSQLSDATGMLDFTQHFASTSTASVSPASGFHVPAYPYQMQQHNMFMAHGGGGGSSHAPPPPDSSSTNDENRNYDNYMF